MHSTLCCPDHLIISVSWCSQEHTYKVTSQWCVEGQLWSDEPDPVHEAHTTESRSVEVVVRSMVLLHRHRLEGARRSAHSLGKAPQVPAHPPAGSWVAQELWE